MLSSKYDKVILGVNSLSLSYGIKFLKENKNTLVLNQTQTPFSDINNIFILESDLYLLQALGKEIKSSTFCDIFEFVSAETRIIYFNETSFFLGSSAYGNLNELVRKIPHIFNSHFPEEFNQTDPLEFDTLFKKGEPSKQELIVKLFGNKPFISESKDFRQLDLLLQQMYQSSFSYDFSSERFLRLFLRFISPHYIVKEQSLFDTLLFEYRKLGGDIKFTEIENWEIQNLEVKTIELNSIDGLVCLDEIYHFEPSLERSPFQFENIEASYSGVEISIRWSSEYLSSYIGKTIIFSMAETFGTDFTYISLYLSSNNKGVFRIYFQKAECSKVNFYYKALSNICFRSLLKIAPDISDVEFFSQLKVKELDLIKVHYNKSSSLSPSLGPDYSKQKTASNFHYYGLSSSLEATMRDHIIDIFSQKGLNTSFMLE